MTNYDKLCVDLRQLCYLAYNQEFHDYLTKQFATPKVELVRRLQEIIDKTKRGDYDQTDVG